MAKDKDHITLNECTKADLLWIINRLTIMQGDYYLKRALNDLWYEKEKQRIAEADKYAKLANTKRREYIELLGPYDGQSIMSIPMKVLDKADTLMKEAQAADKKYMKLMGITED